MPQVSLSNILVREGGEETVLTMTGSGPLTDYQFKKLGQDQFVVELGGIANRADPPALPVGLNWVQLTYRNENSPDGVQILGTLRAPLSHYLWDSVGNDLILTLYSDKGPSGRAPVSAEESDALAGAERPAGARGRSKGISNSEGYGSFDSHGAAMPAIQPKVSPGFQSLSKPGGDSNFVPESQPTVGLLKKRYTGKPISLDLVDADVRNVLRLIADITGTNIVIEPEVTGKVTLKVEQVPWDQLLDIVLSMNDLGKEQVGNVIRIARQGKLKQEWSQQAEEIRAKQELSEVAKDLGDIGTVYFTVNYAQPGEISAKISENKSERGKVSVDERTSLIIYSDYPARIENARQLLSRLDRPTPQVMIEARIVTLRAQATRALGVDWNLKTNHQTNDPGITQQFQVNIPTAGPSSFGLALGQLIGETLLEVDARISALETSQDLKVIAAPKVLTLNNVKAVISQGTKIPFQSVQTQGATTVATTTFQDATVELQVTPHITPDQKIRLEILAKQDEPGVVLNGQTSIDTRQINTELLVDDGNIVVVGGVMRDREDRNLQGTPGVSRIPILGRLFKQEDSSRDKTELLIFINPKIVEATSSVYRK